MIYYTWSQGFRPGAFNRNGSDVPTKITGPDGLKQFSIPNSYQSDNLTNNELGWKTEFLDHRLQWNGALYQENWDNVQVGFFDPGQTGNLSFGTNGQNFRIRGIETSLVARVTSGLTLQGAASYNKSEQMNSPALINSNRPARTSASPSRSHATAREPIARPISNLFGPIGSPSANSPQIQFSLRARYDWTVNDYTPFVQVGSHPRRQFLHAGGRQSVACGRAGPSIPPCCASKTRPTRPTMPRPAWPRVSGTPVCTFRT